MNRYIVGVSGASGMILAVRMVQALAHLGHHIELVITSGALYTATLELGKEYSTATKWVDSFPEEVKNKIHLNLIQDLGCMIASGTYLVDGMVIIPCSMATVAAISMGLGDNALRRAADVTLKEKRPLVVVPRESPFSEIHLENLWKLAKVGATILPPIPAWYLHPKSLEEVENFIVGKVLDAFRLPHNLFQRWGGN